MSVQADIGEKIQAIIDSYRQEASYAKHMADSIEADWGAQDWALLADRRVITQREADIMSGVSPNRRKRVSRNKKRTSRRAR